MAEVAVQYEEMIKPIKTVTLTMSKNEAIALAAVLIQVSGSSMSSIRKHIDNIYDVLFKVLNLEEEFYDKFIADSSSINAKWLANDNPILK